jgi:hypothetical protein
MYKIAVREPQTKFSAEQGRLGPLRLARTAARESVMTRTGSPL